MTDGGLRSALRETGVDAAVQVNQRALIDKILARYSGENTVYRELLQNADDARASQVHFRFKSRQRIASVRPDLTSHLITSIVVKNDGQIFSDGDWARIRKIAEGNPSAESIGAYGVGLYSVFSLCEEPLVTSGDSAVLFHWGKPSGDQLFVKQGPNPHSSADRSWTIFDLALREEAPMPEPMQFCQFLANAMAFTTHLRHIQVFLDDQCLCDLNKKLAPAISVSPFANLARASPKKSMAIKDVHYAGFQLDAHIMGMVLQAEEVKKSRAQPKVLSSATKFFQTAFSLAMANPSSGAQAESTIVSEKIYRSSLFLRIAEADIAITLSSRQIDGLDRAIKKRPPTKTTFQMLYSSKDEVDASRSDDSANAAQVFSGLTCVPGKQGRLAIGFMTHQTSGCAAAIASRFIPTVERESLDLHNGHVADWNIELLSMGGALARIIYEDEVAIIRSQWAQSTSDKDALLARFNHLCRFFTFQPSTPASLVAETAEAAFFSSSKRNEITVLTQNGVMSSLQARLPNAELAAFLKTLPVLSAQTVDDAPVFVAQMYQRSLIKDLSLDDIVGELSSRPLSSDEMRDCLTWWIRLSSDASYTAAVRNRLLNSTVCQVSTADLFQLSAIKHFLGQRSLLIQSSIPTPPATLPFSLSRNFKHSDMQRVFGWIELSIAQEIEFLLSSQMTGVDASEKTDMLHNPQYAEKVLVSIAKIWSNLSAQSQASVIDILKTRPIISTRKGMQKPVDSYFNTVDLFDDLPTVAFTEPVRGAFERLLGSIGVKKHVDLQIIFTRLFSEGSWSHHDLIKYLVTIQTTLTSDELNKLKKTAWLPREGLVTDGQNKSRFTADSLLEPLSTFRSLSLPLLDWPVKWLGSSQEAKFLVKIGLRRHPSVSTLLEAAADPSDAARRKQALTYYLNSYEANQYAQWALGDDDIAFVPSQTADGTAVLSKPSQCFSNSGVAELGFTILNPSLQLEAAKLRVQMAPPPAILLQAVFSKPPSTTTKAQAVFTYLSSRLTDFNSAQWNQIGHSEILPILASDGTVKRYAKPNSCYFAKTSSKTNSLYASIFTFIDFGQGSKPFLAAAGCQEEPTTTEIVRLLMNDPPRFYTLAGSPESYLELLRTIAATSRQLPSPLLKTMRTSPFLVTSIRIAQGKPKENLIELDEDEDEALVRYQLKSPQETVVIDDVNLWRLFGDIVYSCPQEDLLENFAEELGSVRITSIVKDTHRVSGQQDNTTRSENLFALIIERSALFLHERQQASTKEVRRSPDSLKKHLRVVEVNKLETHRTMTYSGRRHVKVLPASATASMEGSDLILFVTKSEEPDWFEVASALIKHILTRQRINDALLFMTLLSTPLKVLQRRGFDTSRILSARKKEQEAAAQRQREAEIKRDIEKATATAQAEEIARTRASSEKDNTLLDAADSPEQKMSGGFPAQELVNQAGPRSLFNTFRKKFGSKPVNGNDFMPPAASPMLDHVTPSNSSTAQGSSSIALAAPSPYAANHATPLSDIRANCLRAIAASRPDQNHAIQNDSELRKVKESEASYCDPSAAADLVYVAEVEQLRFYAGKDISDPATFIEQNLESLKLFASRILHPVAQVFRLDPKALHIFYDQIGSKIAFNRNGSIFVNLRFYQEWHAAQVQQGELDNALISNYFTLCHELAHNLVSQHDSQHEFYLESIAEIHFTRLAQLLGQKPL